MDVRAAVAHSAGAPLVVETVQLDGPKAGEVLVEIKATGICHTDEFTRSGGDPEGLFPAILGHEGAGIVVDVGPGVTTVKKGDHVIPLYTPECRQCKSCLSRKTNLCTAIRATQGKGVMPDGTSRFSLDGKPLYHYMGCSTFANFTVLPEIAVAKIREDAPFDKVCYIGCGVTTGIGAVINTAKVEPGANVVVFGLGGIGLNVVQGARMAGANMIVGVDINPARETLARKFGLTHFVNPKEVEGDLVAHLVELTEGRRRLQLRVHRQRRADAPGARVLPSRLGRIGDHRRRRRRAGDPHAPVPAGDRPRLEGNRVRRRAGPHRRAEDRRLVHGRQDQHRRPDHARPAARSDQRRVRPHACGQIDPGGRHLLTPGFRAGIAHPDFDSCVRRALGSRFATQLTAPGVRRNTFDEEEIEHGTFNPSSGRSGSQARGCKLRRRYAVIASVPPTRSRFRSRARRPSTTFAAARSAGNRATRCSRRLRSRRAPISA